MSLRSHDNVQAKCTELVVIRARMSDLLWYVQYSDENGPMADATLLAVLLDKLLLGV